MKRSFLALLLLSSLLFNACNAGEDSSANTPESPIELADDQESENIEASDDVNELPLGDSERTAPAEATAPPIASEETLPAHGVSQSNGNPVAPAPSAPSTPSTAPAVQTQEKDRVVLVTIAHEKLGPMAQSELLWREGISAYDALKDLADQENLYLQSSGFGPTVYVEGIEHLFEFDEGPLSGWHFLVNGVEGGRGAGQVILEPGDQLLWQYRAEP